MFYRVKALISIRGGKPIHRFGGAATRAAAIALMEEWWERFILLRITDLSIEVISSDGTVVDGRCLDDAQLYYDHRMYRISTTERSYLDLTVPLEEREDPRRYETSIIIGWRDNLDATIAVALRNDDEPITHEYLDELWQSRLLVS